jgi:kynurenine formamidase
MPAPARHGRAALLGLAFLAGSACLLVARTAPTPVDEPEIRGWQQGRGWGWVWGPEDEVGSLNAMTDASRAAALRLATEGRTFDLGLTYSRRSYKWPGHNPAEIISFRTPENIARMGDPDAPPADINPEGVGWHSTAVFISDNVATQIDGLAHITAGPDHHWYNGFKEAEWGGDFGPRKCDATTIPPIVARGVLIDVAAFKGVDVLPAHYAISSADLRGALERQGTLLQPGDVVLVRTGVGRLWGQEGADHEKIAAHDSAGCTLEAARWLVEDQGAMLVGADNSGFEVSPPVDGPGAVLPVHKYLLVDQGVHIAEFHYLEDLGSSGTYVFCYVAATNKIKGTTAGFTLRPLALR